MRFTMREAVVLIMLLAWSVWGTATRASNVQLLEEDAIGIIAAEEGQDGMTVEVSYRALTLEPIYFGVGTSASLGWNSVVEDDTLQTEGAESDIPLKVRVHVSARSVALEDGDLFGHQTRARRPRTTVSQSRDQGPSAICRRTGRSSNHGRLLSLNAVRSQ